MMFFSSSGLSWIISSACRRNEQSWFTRVFVCAGLWNTFWQPSVLLLETPDVLRAAWPGAVWAHFAALWSRIPVPSSSAYMTPEETGISLALAGSRPSSTASLCARILLLTGELLLALWGDTAAPTTTNKTSAATGTTQISAFRMSPLPDSRP